MGMYYYKRGINQIINQVPKQANPQIEKLYERLVTQQGLDPSQMHSCWHSEFWYDFPVEECNDQKGCLIYQITRASGFLLNNGIAGRHIPLSLLKARKAYIHLRKSPEVQVSVGVTASPDDNPSKEETHHLDLCDIVSFGAMGIGCMNDENGERFGRAYMDWLFSDLNIPHCKRVEDRCTADYVLLEWTPSFVRLK
ncbi:MAG: hypothetical protein HY363_00775 [Candidatus Aenigmarchaeota archaeon]|nr:hypothetical protein [Candidatus Aenigmarchaeota archaeon]